MDGSQKIPQRWLETLHSNQFRGADCPSILKALAAWIGYVAGDGHHVEDPKAGDLAALWISAGDNNIASALFGEKGLFSNDWIASPEDLRFLTTAISEYR